MHFGQRRHPHPHAQAQAQAVDMPMRPRAVSDAPPHAHAQGQAQAHTRRLRNSRSRKSLRRPAGDAGALRRALMGDAALQIGRAMRARAAKDAAEVLAALRALTDGAAAAGTHAALGAAARLVAGLRPTAPARADAVLWAQMRAAAALHAQRLVLVAVDKAWDVVRRARAVVQCPGAPRRALDDAEKSLANAIAQVATFDTPPASEAANVLASLLQVVKKRKLGWRGDYGKGWQDAVRSERRQRGSKPPPHRDLPTTHTDGGGNAASCSGKSSPESVRAAANGLFSHNTDATNHVPPDHESIYPSGGEGEVATSASSRPSWTRTRTRTRTRPSTRPSTDEVRACGDCITRAWRASIVRASCNHDLRRLVSLNVRMHGCVNAEKVCYLRAQLPWVDAVAAATSNALPHIARRVASRIRSYLEVHANGSTHLQADNDVPPSAAAANTLCRAARALVVRRRHLPEHLRRLNAYVASSVAEATASGRPTALQAALTRLGDGANTTTNAVTRPRPSPTMARAYAAHRATLAGRLRAARRKAELRALDAGEQRLAEARDAARAEALQHIAWWTERGRLRGNLRLLLATLHRVLPEVRLGDAIDVANPKRVRAIYRRALLHVHPDRLAARSESSPLQHVLAHLVFVELQDAYGEFARNEL